MTTENGTSHPRVFGIGLSRTGTTSLCGALHVLGYTPTHNPKPDGFVRGDFSLFEGQYDSGSDISVAAFYRELDEAFPGSRFILTLRDAEAWLKSVVVHFANLPKNSANGPRGVVRERVYGTHWPTPEQFLTAYKTHIAEVAQYFQGRTDLLVMDVTKGEGWERLCGFLGVPIPDVPFPKSNETTPHQYQRAVQNLEQGKTEGDGVILPVF